ncbi:carotenoid 1,2-hydratase [candidate division KSB1 bacterium]|nr:MAG: carotenoid 1,2-hydratase [candidate division KSB1 bacterium]MBC6947811.1 carotenoid 1,2-hydratase [candidate division KSB1 bacterium]MCE7943651.1 carotenoid 1,2-hydratase [Chlorobi bacterium CHB1]MDL1878276.1 carotenoid 1,2-hydratase [Cytophagia bacterium CHB2]
MKIFLSLLGIVAWALALASVGRPTQADTREKQKSKASFIQALSPRAWQFPRDHGQHPEFRTEWWYFTGNLQSEDGRAFGYQFAIFRNALTPAPANRASAWAFRDGYVAHFGITDIAQRKFYYDQKIARGALQLAGASRDSLHAFVGDWSARGAGKLWQLQAASGFGSIAFVLEHTTPPVLHGNNGLVQKGAQPGEASYYYSLPNLKTTGQLVLGADSARVSGASWMDHEFFTGVDSGEMAGWDWFSLHLSDSTAIMLYRLRRANGATSPFSAGTLILPGGATRHLSASEFEVEPGGWRQSKIMPESKYPLAWKLRFADYALSVTTPVENQELDTRQSTGVVYWEGYVNTTGTKAGRQVTGKGYLEMTGYVASARPKL